MTERIRIKVYDPNVLNPYGFELARTLVNGGEPVSLWTSRGQQTRTMEGDHLDVRRTLAADRGNGNSLVRNIADRLLGVVRFVLSVRRSDIVVVAWTRDWWDASVLLMRALLGGGTVAVYHNPRQIRPRKGLVGWIEQRLFRVSETVVHSGWLATVVSGDLPHVHVASHPPYLSMRRYRSTQVSDDPVFVFVGALRPDKGSDALLEIARETKSSWTLKFLGAGSAADAIAQCVKPPVKVLNLKEHARPSDEVLARELSGARGLLAPYTSVTTSGTMVLAASLDVPIVTFESAALDGLPPHLVNVAGTSSEMAELVERLVAGTDRHAENESLKVWVQRCEAEWRDVIGAARLRRRAAR